jgi:hypothetical protein
MSDCQHFFVFEPFFGGRLLSEKLPGKFFLYSYAYQKERFMRITKSKFRQFIQEELLREGVIGQDPLFDEEQQAVDLTRELAALYRTLQGSHRTEEVMEMEDAYTGTFQDIKSQKMRQGSIYALVGIAKAIVDLGLRSSSKDQEEYKDY